MLRDSAIRSRYSCVAESRRSALDTEFSWIPSSAAKAFWLVVPRTSFRRSPRVTARRPGSDTGMTLLARFCVLHFCQSPRLYFARSNLAFARREY